MAEADERARLHPLSPQRTGWLSRDSHGLCDQLIIVMSALRLPSAGDCSHKRIFTTITQAVGSSFQASFQAPLSGFDVRTLLPEVRQARGIDFSQLSEGQYARV